MADRNEMKNFLKEHPFTPEVMKQVIHKFDLEKVDLSVEKIRVEEKRSYLSARQRKAVLELALIQELMEEIEKEKVINEEIQETVNFTTN